MDSLVNQTFHNLQIICINDGSSDNSFDIINEYAKKHSQIQIIDQKNKGYGAALNKGFSYIQADYVSIIEPDDYLALNAFETFYNEIQGHPEADIVKFAFWCLKKNNGTVEVVPSNSSELRLPENSFEISQYPQLLLYHPSVWSCVYKTSFLKENHIHFIEAPGAGWTDNPFFIASMCLARNILWRDHKVYYYRQGHATASSNLKNCKIPLLRLMEILDFVEEKKVRDFGILLCVYKRVFSYIRVVRDNEYYIKNDVESLIHKILSRLDLNVINTEFFTSSEKDIFYESNNGKGW